jgi:hypothetical protein
MRLNKDNVILIGLMPGRKEAKLDKINNYLVPLVDDLLKLHNVVEVSTKVYVALLLLTCDILACRKAA